MTNNCLVKGAGDQTPFPLADQPILLHLTAWPQLSFSLKQRSFNSYHLVTETSSSLQLHIVVCVYKYKNNEILYICACLYLSTYNTCHLSNQFLTLLSGAYKLSFLIYHFVTSEIFFISKKKLIITLSIVTVE